MRLEEINKITERIIGCGIEVHRHLGPGMLESVYSGAMCVEMTSAGLKFRQEVVLPVMYKGVEVGKQRIDLLVEDEVIVELKSVEEMNVLFEAQLLGYLKMSGKRVGLLMNFNATTMRDGIKRLAV